MKKYLFWGLLFAGLAGVFAPQVFTETKPNKSTFTVKEMALHGAMLKLISDHITWQRILAIETITGAKNTMKARDRLDKNLEDIGNAFKPFYGADTAGRISDLFKQHVQLLADYANMAKSTVPTKPVVDKLLANADAIAALLAQKNPNWNRTELSTLFRTHVNDLTTEVDGQVLSPGTLDVNQMDLTSDHGIMIADTLAYGLINQFPDKFK